MALGNSLFGGAGRLCALLDEDPVEESDPPPQPASASAVAEQAGESGEGSAQAHRRHVIDGDAETLASTPARDAAAR